MAQGGHYSEITGWIPKGLRSVVDVMERNMA